LSSRSRVAKKSGFEEKLDPWTFDISARKRAVMWVHGLFMGTNGFLLTSLALHMRIETLWGAQGLSGKADPQKKTTDPPGQSLFATGGGTT
jgi:hypothetical protein